MFDVAEQDRELVAAEPRDDVLRPQGRLQSRGDFDEQAVADRMAQGVVDVLEAVEIEAEHGEALAGAQAQRGVLDAFAEQDAVGEAGQRVVAGGVGELLLRLPAFGDVDDDADRAQRPAVVVVEIARAQFQTPDGAVLGAPAPGSRRRFPRRDATRLPRSRASPASGLPRESR